MGQQVARGQSAAMTRNELSPSGLVGTPPLPAPECRVWALGGCGAQACRTLQAAGANVFSHTQEKVLQMRGFTPGRGPLCQGALWV